MRGFDAKYLQCQWPEMDQPDAARAILDILKQHDAVFRAQAAAIQELTEVVRERLEYEVALTAACGGLFAELAHISKGEVDMDAMLARVLGRVEMACEGAKGALLASDRLRAFAETLAKDLSPHDG
jgi:hypothetical protein